MEMQQGRIDTTSFASPSHDNSANAVPFTSKVLSWDPTFSYAGRVLHYNRIPINNCAERAVEVPLAFDFLARQTRRPGGIGRMLELGHVLHSYENGLSVSLGLNSRRIVDKFEVSPGVENIDFMDIAIEPDKSDVRLGRQARDRYDTIVSISTVEHIGQHRAPSGEFGERVQSSNREAPLCAIARIYALLAPGGRALVTVPAGCLTDGGWYIQFSPAYLELLHSWYGLPRQDVELRFLRQIAREPRWCDLGRNPRQSWVESTASKIAAARYDDTYGGARAIAVIELTRSDAPYTLPHDASGVPLLYASSPGRKRLFRWLGGVLSAWR